MLFVVAAVLVIPVFFVIGVYNGLIRLSNQTKNAWSQIDVQLKRRHDLIPNLVETVKGYAAHERGVFEEIASLRTTAQQTTGVAASAAAESALGGALSRMLAVVENYPDLKANQNFLSLQEELASTENKIAFARQFYNDSVMHLNTRIETFPSNLIANAFAFRRAEFFEMDDAARATPNVAFGDRA